MAKVQLWTLNFIILCLFSSGGYQQRRFMQYFNLISSHNFYRDILILNNMFWNIFYLILYYLIKMEYIFLFGNSFYDIYMCIFCNYEILKLKIINILN